MSLFDRLMRTGCTVYQVMKYALSKQIDSILSLQVLVPAREFTLKYEGTWRGSIRDPVYPACPGRVRVRDRRGFIR